METYSSFYDGNAASGGDFYELNFNQEEEEEEVCKNKQKLYWDQEYKETCEWKASQTKERS